MRPKAGYSPWVFDSGRLLKTAQLRRWEAEALVAAYLEYASLGLAPSALQLDRFERPARWDRGIQARAEAISIRPSVTSRQG